MAKWDSLLTYDEVRLLANNDNLMKSSWGLCGGVIGIAVATEQVGK